jgi:hypothetical protein
MPDDQKPTNTQNTVPAASKGNAANPPQLNNPPSTPPQPTTSANDQQKVNTENVGKKEDVDAVVTSAHVPKKYGGKKIIATIFGVVLLVGAVAAGVYLVQRQQQIAERAATGAACDQDPDCILLENIGNSGSFNSPRNVTKLYITARDFHEFGVGESDNGCYKVNVSGSFITWERYGSGPDCKDISNIQIWLEVGGATPTPLPSDTPTPTPTEVPGASPTPTSVNKPSNTPSPTPSQISAQCSEVKAYDTNWNQLSSGQLSQLQSGDVIHLTVSGSASSGAFDKARFEVNGTSIGESTQKKSGTDEFYINYTIPSSTTSFSVKGEIHHSDLGWI